MKELKTERLFLETWKRKDAKELFEYAKNENVGPHAGWKPHESIRESKEIIKNVFRPNHTWKIVFNGQTVGSIGFEPDGRRSGILSKEMGYSLDENFWGMGIMTEAARAVMAYGFNDLKLGVISITTGIENKRSQRVIEKLGFIYEGTERYAYKIFDGSVRDVLVYSFLKEDWVK